MANTYTTTQGDTWDIVSLKAYGTEKNMGELIMANPDYRDVVIFNAGAVLVVPTVTKTRPSTLPPWKR